MSLRAVQHQFLGTQRPRKTQRPSSLPVNLCFRDAEELRSSSRPLTYLSRCLLWEPILLSGSNQPTQSQPTKSHPTPQPFVPSTHIPTVMIRHADLEHGRLPVQFPQESVYLRGVHRKLRESMMDDNASHYMQMWVEFLSTLPRQSSTCKHSAGHD